MITVTRQGNVIQVKDPERKRIAELRERLTPAQQGIVAELDRLNSDVRSRTQRGGNPDGK